MILSGHQIRASLGDNIVILAAFYEYADYSGHAEGYYLDTATRKFYRFGGSHCSCYGLEDSWEPEEVSVKDILVDLGHFERALADESARSYNLLGYARETTREYVDGVKAALRALVQA